MADSKVRGVKTKPVFDITDAARELTILRNAIDTLTGKLVELRSSVATLKTELAGLKAGEEDDRATDRSELITAVLRLSESMRDLTNGGG